MPTAVPVRPKANRLFIAGAALLCLMLGLGGLAAWRYASAEEWVGHSLAVQRELDGWTMVMGELQSTTRAYVASANPELLSGHAGLVIAERTQAGKVRRLIADNLPQREVITRADRHAELAVSYFEQQLARVQSGRQAEAMDRLARGEGRDLVDQFRAAARSVRAEENRLLEQQQRAATESARATLLGAFLVAATAVALLGFAWRRELQHDAVVTDMARSARGRLRLLADLASALAATRTVAEVADVVVEHGMRAAGGDTCTLYALNAESDALELIAQHGVAPNVIEKIRVISAQHGNPETYRSVRERRSVWAESMADYAALYPTLAATKVEGPRAQAFWSVPLIAEDQALGLLGVGFFSPRKFTQDERAFVDTLAHQCAQALLRAKRTEAEEEARRWFSTTLRSIGDAVIATDEHGKIQFINPVAERLTGYDEAQALGRPLEAVFHIISEHSRAVVESPVTKVLREGKVVGLANHTVLLPRQGPEVPIDDSGAPIRNEAGEIVGVVLVFRDVSSEKRQEARNAFMVKAGEALVASLDYEATLSTVARLTVPHLADWCAVNLVDGVGGRIKQVAVAHVDPSKVRYAEELGRRYPPSEDSGEARVIRTGKSELYPEIPDSLLQQLARDAEHLRIARELDLKSAIVVPLRARESTLGSMTFVYAGAERRYTMDDLVFVEELARRAAMAIENAIALKAAHEARDRERWLRAEAERANRLKDDFLATASHELRTPLNAILGWTLTLRRGVNNPETDRALGIVERNARAQAKLIEDVLDVSRIVSGKLVLTLRTTTVSAAARAAIETVTPAADAKGITLLAELEAEPALITADPNRLQQVIWNLLSNSVKFTAKGGHVTVRTYRDGSEVCVMVQDSGEGIRADLLTAIFEPFQQADSSTTRRHGGLGLGLAIVKQLVEAHGGSVHAASDGPGHGSSFVVRLPVRAVAPGREHARDTPPGARPPNAVGLAPMRLDRLRILVVDDEYDARQLIHEILHQHGAEVTMVGSAAEARQVIESSTPHAIVSDVGMADEDGYSFIRKLRANGSSIPAVALTAYASLEDARRALDAGFQKHITKPVEPLMLVGVLASLAQGES
jgi:PAS domain S-box-containing protein